MTAPWLLNHAPHRPFMDRHMARAPGLMPLAPGALISLDPDFAAQMAERERLIAGRPETVLAELAEGADPARELLDYVANEAARLPGFRREGAVWHRPDGARAEIDDRAPLASLGRMVAEDFCLLLPDDPSGEYRLVAAVLCFPSRWLLSEKIGRPLTAIHDPVPDYDAMLARRVNRVFEALRPGRALWRVNWLVHATPELHLPMGLSDKLVAAADPGAGLYLRTERQTLTRLPQTGAVAFGIKTSVTPLAALAPDEAAALEAALGGLDPASVAYRSGSDSHGAALARLGEIAGQAAQGPADSRQT